jgi:hypothetical protein
VALVFIACYTIDSRSGELFHEIENGLNPKQWEIVSDLLAQQPVHWLQPRDQAEAREVLFQIVDRVMRRLERRFEVHQQRDDLNATYAADLFAVDNSKEGDRLRHYALSCSRDLIRIVESFVKMRKAGNTDKLVPVAVTTEPSTDSTAAINPQISQIEPNFDNDDGQVIESALPDDLEISRIEPNFHNFERPVIDSTSASVSAVEIEMSQIEPNFDSSDCLVIDSASPCDSQIEPNFVSIRNTKAIEFGNPERTVRFRVERTHRSTRRKRSRHGRRDEVCGRLKTREPTRGARTAARLCELNRAYIRCKTNASSRPLRPPRVEQRKSLSRCFLTRIAA